MFRKKPPDPKRKISERKGAPTTAVAFPLHRELSTDPGNFIFSPYSVSLALAMIHAGAVGHTREEIGSVLGCVGVGDELSDRLGEVAQALESRSRPAPFPFYLSVALALCVQVGYPINVAYEKVLRRRLAADILEVNFAEARQEAVRTVNARVEQATNGTICDVLKESNIGQLTRVLLVNAIYFKAQWLNLFAEELTKFEPFHLLDGQRVDVPMMHVQNDFRYARRRDVQALELPYGNDWIVMTVLLPDKDKLDEVEQMLDTHFVDRLTQEMKPVEVQLSFPKFRVESSFLLSSPLTELGIEIAFGRNADFSRLSAEPGFAVDELVHRTFITVDEQGTEAASATAVTMIGAATFPLRPLIFRVDRPFLFLIQDKPTGTILFMGRVVNPREANY